jgi:hypothetical protein
LTQYILYPGREFQPQGDPSEWEFESYLAAAVANSHLGGPQVQPVYPIEYRHTLPYVFFEQEPETFQKFESAWQNQSTAIMPVWFDRDRFGNFAGGMPFFNLVLSTPTFLPDGTAAATPTSTEPSAETGSGRTSTEPV